MCVYSKILGIHHYTIHCVYEEASQLADTKRCIPWTFVFRKCKKTWVRGTFPNRDNYRVLNSITKTGWWFVCFLSSIY